VFERYFKGSDEINGRRVESVSFDADTLHNIKSATKSVASLALGIAIDRGLITRSRAADKTLIVQATSAGLRLLHDSGRVPP